MKTELSLNEIEEIKNNEWVILSTSNNNIPRSIVVMPSRIESNKITLSNIQMNKTIENIKENPNCFINVYIKEKNDKQYKINCICEIFSNGDLFNEIKEYKIIVLERDNDELEDIIKNDKLLSENKESIIKINGIDIINLSSTMIREKIKRGENVDKFIDKDVLEYIKENNLYN